MWPLQGPLLQCILGACYIEYPVLLLLPLHSVVCCLISMRPAWPLGRDQWGGSTLLSTCTPHHLHVTSHQVTTSAALMESAAPKGSTLSLGGTLCQA